MSTRVKHQSSLGQKIVLPTRSATSSFSHGKFCFSVLIALLEQKEGNLEHRALKSASKMGDVA